MAYDLLRSRRENIGPRSSLGTTASSLLDGSVVLVVAILLGALAFWRPMQLQDEALVIVYADQLRAGRWPHADFFTVYGPGTFGVVAAAFSVLGASDIVERLVGLVYHVVIATGLMYATRPLGRRLSLICGTVSLVAMLPLDLIAYAWLGGLALVVWEIGLLARASGTATTVLAGVLGGLVPLFRPEMALLSSMAAIPLLWRERRAWAFVAGYLGSLSLFLGYVAVVGSSLFTNVVASRLATDGRLSLATLPGTALVGGVLAIVSAALLVGIGVRRRNRFWLSGAVLAVVMLPQTFQRLDFDHVAFSVCVTTPLALAAMLGPVGKPSVSLTARSTGLTLVVAVVAISAAFATVRPLAVGERLSVGDRSLFVAPEEVAAMTGTLDKVRSLAPAGSRVFVGATDMSVVTLSRIGLYHLLPDYTPSTYFLELPPAAIAMGSGLPEQIASADLLLLSDVDPALNSRLFPNYPRGSTEANEVVAQRFCERARTSLAHLLVRCR